MTDAQDSALLHIALVQPEIPQNAGNVARTCAVLGAHLHLVHPLGFRLDDRHLRRAGVDYWDLVSWTEHDDWPSFAVAWPAERVWLVTTRGGARYDEVRFQPGDCLVFGSESRGLPLALVERYPGRGLRIPMRPGARSLNLSNSVAVVAFEAYRQWGFPGLV
ncbi:MAG: tRNA (cytidine(34)-2'-O)-methyltransferase [Firmicutes bacterium]|nr:tRNA (cytidine(34)-2'-O)-methyltransferase [Bacillota bacterium]